MSLITRILSVGLTALAASLLWLGVAFAQSGGCSTDRSGPQDVLHCPDGLTIIVEKGARYSLADRNGDGQLDAARLQSKALLIDLPRHDKPTRFEVITPQAIAAVRGTRWAVDVQRGKTSVFVVSGQRRRAPPGRATPPSCSVRAKASTSRRAARTRWSSAGRRSASRR